MMRSILSFSLSFALALPSIAGVFRAPASTPEQDREAREIERSCPNGECVAELIGLTEAKLRQARQNRCLPPEGTRDEAKWFEDNPVSIPCLRLIKELEENLKRLEKIQAHFSSLLIENDELQCKAEEANAVNAANLAQLDAVNAAASCTEARKREIWNQCAADAGCVLVSSALTVAGPFANRLIPNSMRQQGCNAHQDNCLSQLALGFVKAVFSFFEGAWGLLKSAGSAIASGTANAARGFWGWVTGAEDQSSTAQLSAAKASEEEGVFQELKKDFSGTMSKLWTGLMAALKHWLANSMFCQQWSGAPQFSECLRPAQGLACTECKAMITGMCAISGVIIAEIIPAFLTGGLVTVAKYGVSAASHVSKSIKVSVASSRAIQNSRLASMAVRPVTAATRTIVQSRFTQAALRAMDASVKSVGRFLVRPAIVGLKKTFAGMQFAARTLKTFLMLTPAGPVLTFGTKAASLAGRAIIWPFDNAMVIKSFQLGERSLDRIFQNVGNARLFSGVRPALAGEAGRAMSLVDDAYIEMRVTQHTRIPGSGVVVEAKEKYLRVLRQQRPQVVDDYLLKKPQVTFDRLVDDLYPELHYGKYAAQLKTDDVLAAEAHLYEAITRMTNDVERTRLLADFNKHITSVARAENLAGAPTFTRPQVLKNATLGDEERVASAFALVKIDVTKIPEKTVNKLTLALREAHEVGSAGVYRYRYNEIAQKYRILTEAGFTNRQAELLIRSGLAGKAHPEDVLDALARVHVPEVKPQAIEEMLKVRGSEQILSAMSVERRASAAKALKSFEDAGMSADEAAATYRLFQKEFDHVYRLAPESNAEVMMAEIIRKQRQAGLSDDAIRVKIEEKVGKCR